jgi:hypothetical protein
VTALDAARPDAPVYSPIGEMAAGTLGAYALAHLLQHGSQIARALRQPLPLEKAYIELTLPFLFYVLPLMTNPERTRGLDACFEIRLRRGPRFCVTFDDGVAAVSATPPRRVDCHILAEPLVFFLVALGLVNQWSGIARGKLVTWGPKPWLALRFVRFFDVP